MTFGIGIFDKVRYNLIFMYILMCLPQTHYQCYIKVYMIMCCEYNQLQQITWR